jgi:hypothetical protein
MLPAAKTISGSHLTRFLMWSDKKSGALSAFQKHGTGRWWDWILQMLVAHCPYKINEPFSRLNDWGMEMTIKREGDQDPKIRNAGAGE